jgi:hypothetical protein
MVQLVDRASLDSVPGRKAPGDPMPIFTMTVKAGRIAYIQFSGPREGEYLAADERAELRHRWRSTRTNLRHSQVRG